MKQFLYIFCLLSLVACNADKTKTTDAKTATDLQAPVAAEGLNPAHGAPGHRCDIAVGAPLSSPLAQPNSTIQQSTPAPQMPAATTTPAASGQGQKLNPAHGMPGHDCALPVGAPLS